MNESQRTRDLLAELRQDPGLTIIKHCDRFTKGVPDTSVTGYMRTTWLEFKDPPVRVDLMNYIRESMLQLHLMCELDKPNGFAHYCIWRGNRLQVWRPRALMLLARQHRSEKDMVLKDVVNTTPPMVIMDDLLYSPTTVGGIRFEDAGYKVLRRILTRSQ
jgi:hypothetical protein